MLAIGPYFWLAARWQKLTSGAARAYMDNYAEAYGEAMGCGAG